MSEEHRCPRCNAPFWHFTGVNTRKFECGSDIQIPSKACRYASQLQDRIKRLEDSMSEIAYAASHPLGAGQSLTLGKIESIAIKAKEAKP